LFHKNLEADEGIGEEVVESGGLNKLNNKLNIMTSSASFSSEFSISTSLSVENKINNTKPKNTPMCNFFR